MVLCFNYAIWLFRKRDVGTHNGRSGDWSVLKLVDLIRTLLSDCKKRSKKKARVEGNDSNDHEEVLLNIPKNATIIYTDGSAFANPGLAGAGGTIMDFFNNIVIDVGISLGKSTNNVGELAALWVVFYLVGCRRVIGPIFIFTDSLYAINALKSKDAEKKKKKGVTHSELIARTRDMLSAALRRNTITLQWVRGHADIGGNERADNIAKIFAKASSGATRPFAIDTSRIHYTVKEWPYALGSVPQHVFTSNLPVVPVSYLSEHSCSPKF